MAITAAVLKVEVIANTSNAEKGVTSFGNKLNSAAKNMAQTGAGLTAAITAPLIRMAAAALSSAADFEQNMNILQAVTGASSNAMAAMQEQALQLGADTVFSAGEAAEAMVELGKAGMGTSDIMAAIGGVMDLAAAGGIGLAQAANLTANALNAFHLAASESTRVADLFAATAAASSADIADLGAGMQAAGFAFAAANQPIENLAASLAILTNVGLTGSDAGTALKNAFMRMMNPTQEALDVMNQLSISFYDAQGSMKQLPEIIDMLNASMAGLTDEQRDAALSTIFMSDGMKAMIPLMDQGSTGFNKMVGEVTRVGAASELADALMKGLGGAMEYLSGSVNTFLTRAALPFLGTLGELTRGAGDALTSFGKLPQPIISATLAFAGVMAAAGPLLLALSGLAAGFAFLISPIGLVVTATAGLAAAWTANIDGIQGITATVFAGVQGWFSSTLASAKSLASGIAAAFSNTTFPSLETLWQQFQAGDFATIANTIRSTTYELMVNLDAELNISGKADQLKQQLVGVVNSLGTAVSNLDFSGATANLNSMRDGILSGISTAIEGVDWGQGGSTFAGMIDSLTTSINSLDFSGIDWAATFERILLGPMGAALAALQWVMDSSQFSGLVTSVKDAISTIDWGELGVSFASLGTAILAQLGTIATDMATDIGSLFTQVTSSISTFFSGFTMPKLPELPKITFEGVFTGVADLITGMTNAINSQDWTAIGTGFVTTIGSAIQGAFVNAAGFIAAIPEAIGTMADGIDAAVDNMRQAFNAWWETTAGDFTAAFNASGITQAFAGLGSALDTALTGFITGAKNVIGGAFIGLGSTISIALTSAVASARTTAGTALASLGSGISISVSNAIASARTTVGTAFTSLGTAIGTALSDAITSTLTTVKTVFASLGSAISTALGGLISSVLGSLGLGGGTGGAGLGGRPLEDWTGGDQIAHGPKGRQSPIPPARTAQAAEPLDWSTFVKPLDWLAFVSVIEWEGFVSMLTWETFVSTLDWESFVPPVEWTAFVPTVNWGSFIETINWGSFVPDINWSSYVPSMSWGDFIPALFWGDYISALNLPGVGGGASATPASAAGVNINVEVASMNSDLDVHAAATKLAREFQKKMR